MQFSEIKTTFTGILNRRDITPSQITSFMTLGSQYVSRKLRVPFMETVTTITSDGTGRIPVPADYEQIIALYTDDAVYQAKLERRDLQTVLKANQRIGSPLVYCRVGTNLMIGPVPVAGTTIYMNYYAIPAALVADTDTNWLTQYAPSCLVYAALKYAADFFLDDRKDAWTATLTEDLADVQSMADLDELTNASMTPVYPDQTQPVY